MTTNEKREAIACMQLRKERLARRIREFDRLTGQDWLFSLYYKWWEAADYMEREMLAELRAERGHLSLVTRPEDDEEAAA